ncbi:MAG: glycosyltransferase family 4 protein [Opitutaceae bacterium]|nr:glycosyltransferase family 4 protein [Opitutaceae bacterium]
MKTASSETMGAHDSGGSNLPAMPPDGKPVVLHYTGYTVDGGGILAVVRALVGEGRFHCLLGVNPDFQQRGRPRLPLWHGPPIRGERIDPLNALRALRVAWRVRRWLRGGAGRIFHGHSRAGLLVALWLALLGERRVIVTVHVFGRQRWFYRRAAALLGERLYWLGPAMKRHYRIGAETWSGCLPDCVPNTAVRPVRSRPPHPVVIFGCVGGLVPVKQWELVIRALACLPREMPVRVVHAGREDGSAASAAYAARLRRLGDELGVADRIEWRGETGDMVSFYEGIDCLIVPSPWEASSVAALEAVAAGVPVLAAETSGTRDLVECCEGGWLFAADSAEALGQRMLTLARGPDLPAWRRNDAALVKFTAAHAAAAHAAVYRSLLGR